MCKGGIRAFLLGEFTLKEVNEIFELVGFLLNYFFLEARGVMKKDESMNDRVMASEEALDFQ